MEESKLMSVVADAVHEYFLRNYQLSSSDALRRLGTLAYNLSAIALNLDTRDRNTLAHEDNKDISVVFGCLKERSKVKDDASLDDEWTVHGIRRHITQFVEKATTENSKEAIFIQKMLHPACEGLLNRLLREQCKVRSYYSQPESTPDTISFELPDTFKKKLLQGLRYQSLCSQCNPLETEETNLERRHCTRLALKHTWSSGQDDDRVAFDIIVAASHMQHWQDIRLSVRRTKKVKFADDSISGKLKNRDRIAQVGDVCQVLRSRNPGGILFEYAGEDLIQIFDGFLPEQHLAPGPGMPLSVALKRCTLQVKDKLILASLTTTAFWQFYDTDLHHQRWTSDSIVLMLDRFDADLVPMKPYVSVNLDAVSSRQEEYIVRAHLIHRYPRLLALAIILIEIGLNDTLQPEKKIDENSQMNEDYIIAAKGLERLQQASWEGFSSKHIFEEVIKRCLQSKNYDIEGEEHEDGYELCQRRQTIYNKLVWPMQRLVETGFPANNEEPTRFEVRVPTDAGSSTRKTAGDINILGEQSAQFHGKQPNPLLWLDDFKEINSAIIIFRNAHKVKNTNTVKVAILDTGCDISAPIFKRYPRLTDNIRGWKDFAASSPDKVDADGHGTFMTGLLLSTAPGAELHLARVAEHSDDILGSASAIAKAIQWAASVQNVDIISMSFGFQAHHPVEEIQDSIVAAMAHRKSKLIILASSGNFGPTQKNESFPASHGSVISMRATDPMGTFHATNPNNDRRRSIVLGTIGDHIPSILQQHNPDVCRPGSSAATVVAAGISAFLLTHAEALSEVYGRSSTLDKMWTLDGMKQVLIAMSDDQGRRQWFLNPVKFFSDVSHWKLYHRYISILS